MDGFEYWFSGFADGEGSFIVAKSTRGGVSALSFAPRFSLALRADDIEILEICKERFNGSIRVYSRYRKSGFSGECLTRPIAFWNVCGKNDTIKIVEVLDRCPLRTKKKRDYEIWREAVILYQNPPRLPNGRIDWSVFQEYKTRLEDTRKYPGEVLIPRAPGRSGSTVFRPEKEQ